MSAVTDNAAVLQQRVTKATNPFLSTLAEPGEAQFLTVLKPCGILLPHVHQRANEFYSVIFGAPRSHVRYAHAWRYGAAGCTYMHTYSLLAHVAEPQSSF